MKRFLGRFALLLVFSACLLSCGGATLVEPPQEDIGAPGGGAPAPTATGVLDEVLPTRTPEPTATPGVIARGVEEVAAETGLAWTCFHTYPDPRYRIETAVNIAYGTDIEVAERLIIDAVRQVPGVLAGEEIEVLYDKMGDWAMTLCIRWWIESYVDARRVHDQAHRTLQRTLDAAGIEMPYPTQALHLYDESEVTDGDAT